MRFTKASEQAHWSAADIRDMCVINGYYTCGDNEEYRKMLRFVSENPAGLENMLLVADDIFKHSDINWLMEKYGEDEKGIFESILSNIGMEIYRTYIAG